MRKRVREALFSVVKGETGPCKFFCRTERLLICPGRGRGREEMADQREGGRKRMLGQEEEEMEGSSIERRRRRWEELMKCRT